MTDEAIVAAAPDVVVMMQGRRRGAAGARGGLRPPGRAWPRPRPRARRRLVTMDGLYLLGFGPRTPEAARELMRRALSGPARG